MGGPKTPVGQHQWDPILVGIGEFTTHVRTYFRWGLGCLLGVRGTHSHMDMGQNQITRAAQVLVFGSIYQGSILGLP